MGMGEGRDDKLRGPLAYRRSSSGEDTLQEVERYLMAYGGERNFVGHTPTNSMWVDGDADVADQRKAVVRQPFGGKVVRIDTRISELGGQLSAVEIVNGKLIVHNDIPQLPTRHPAYVKLAEEVPTPVCETTRDVLKVK